MKTHLHTRCCRGGRAPRDRLRVIDGAASSLVGTVGPGFTISLKHNGKVFKTLKHGRYTFAISDKASIHNFQIEGPGVDRAITTVSFMGTKTVTIMLRKGTYKFYCAPHESSMYGSFKVT